MKRPSQKPSPIIDVLQRLFENSKSPLSAGFQRWKLEGNWSTVVGVTLAKYSRPVQYDKGVLTIEVASSAWMQEIRFMSEDIKNKVNDYMGSHWVSRIQLIHK